MKVRQLNECTALLTGATTSIGFESAAQLAEAGVPRIMIVGRSEERGKKAVDAIKARAPGCDVRFFSGDPTKYAGAEKIVQAAIDAFGAIDILVNSIPGPSNGTPARFRSISEKLPEWTERPVSSSRWTRRMRIVRFVPSSSSTSR